MPFPTPLYGDDGKLAGAMNLLVDITERTDAEVMAQRLAAIVESSNDAIVAKDLEGTITSWNTGAERLFGYLAREVIGKPVTILIPEDRLEEETVILATIRRGEKVPAYETVRRRKDGTLVDVSLAISPIKNAEGRIVGASKIARDITERRRAQEQQDLLLREMNHRVKNAFALAIGLVRLSTRSARTPEELGSAIEGRLAALGRAHTLTLSQRPKDDRIGNQTTTMHALIRTILAPYLDATGEGRTRVSGDDTPIGGSSTTAVALLLHEFATNAAKYGALSAPEGNIEIQCAVEGDQFALTWIEHGGPPIACRSEAEGFGSLLTQSTVQRQLGGEISREWRPEGLVIRLCVPRDRLDD
jgi:PAS domain S-box-containing protein